MTVHYPEIASPNRHSLPEQLVRLGFFILVLGVILTMPFSRRAIFLFFPIGVALIVFASPFQKSTQTNHLKSVFLSNATFTLAFVILWAAFSLAWTPSFEEAALKLAKFSGTVFLLALVLSLILSSVRPPDVYIIPISLAICALMTAGEFAYRFMSAGGAGEDAMFADFSGKGGDVEDSFVIRSTLTLAILVWPGLKTLLLRERRLLAGLFATLVAIVMLIANNPFIYASLVAGILILTLALDNTKRAALWLGGAGALVFFAAPFLCLGLRYVTAHHYLTLLPMIKSFATPLYAWADIIKIAPVRLITGYGLDASVSALQPRAGEAIIAPKSFIFEIWFELGVLGALGVTTLIVLSAMTISRLHERVAPFALANYACVLVLIFSGIVTTQLWWVTLLCLNLIIIKAVIRGQRRSGRLKAKLFINREEAQMGIS